jgi:hypothetical protein
MIAARNVQFPDVDSHRPSLTFESTASTVSLTRYGD